MGGGYQVIVIRLQEFGSLFFLSKMILFLLVCYRAHNGRRIRFSNDESCGQTALYHQFPNVFMLVKRQNVFTIDNFSYHGGGIVWDFSFRRNLLECEISDFAFLLGLLSKVFLLVSNSDVKSMETRC